MHSNLFQTNPKCTLTLETPQSVVHLTPLIPHYSLYSQGIYIGDTFFPMRPQQEELPHDLYLRASSAAKKMPPLKLYASVVGKFIVERELGDSVRDKVRESTIDAANQRSGRTTILLETPPDVSNNKKRKDPPMFRKPVRAADKPKTIQPSTNRPSPAPVHVPKEGSSKLRNHIIHWLAMGERTEDQLVGLVGKPSLRAAVCNILAEVCGNTLSV